MNNDVKTLAVWGSPSSGKTVTSIKIAKELSAMKKNVIIIFSDIFSPVLSTVMPSCDIKNRTLGSLLSKPAIKQSDVLRTTIPYHEYIGVIGYKNGDNLFTYSEFLKERVIDLFTQLSQITDYIIVDCSSILTEDSFATLAMQLSDRALRLCGADLKSLSYFSSQLPLISRPKFKSDGHIKLLSNTKAVQEESAFRTAYGGTSYTLPHVPELEQQFYSATLINNLTSKAAKSYNAEMSRLVREVLC